MEKRHYGQNFSITKKPLTHLQIKGIVLAILKPGAEFG
tara:strand:- start:22484 stop:22597 length:114 start_codon:yes stop_codon:yes gene_type:complete